MNMKKLAFDNLLFYEEEFKFFVSGIDDAFRGVICVEKIRWKN